MATKKTHKTTKSKQHFSHKVCHLFEVLMFIMCHFKCSYTVCLIWRRELYRLKVYFLTSSTVCVYVESEDHTLWLTELLWVWPSCHFTTFSEPNSHWLLQFCPERDNGTFWAQIWNSLENFSFPPWCVQCICSSFEKKIIFPEQLSLLKFKYSIHLEIISFRVHTMSHFKLKMSLYATTKQKFSIRYAEKYVQNRC